MTYTMGVDMSIMGTARQIGAQFADFSEGYVNFVLLMAMAYGEAFTDKLLGDDLQAAHPMVASQVQTIITVVVVAVVAIVGILIYAEVDSSITVTGDLSNSADNLTAGFGDAMELVPIVLIVLVAALVIGVIQRFRS